VIATTQPENPGNVASRDAPLFDRFSITAAEPIRLEASERYASPLFELAEYISCSISGAALADGQAGRVVLCVGDKVASTAAQSRLSGKG
jgi:hypothetical protein